MCERTGAASGAGAIPVQHKVQSSRPHAPLQTSLASPLCDAPPVVVRVTLAYDCSNADRVMARKRVNMSHLPTVTHATKNSTEGQPARARLGRGGSCDRRCTAAMGACRMLPQLAPPGAARNRRMVQPSTALCTPARLGRCCQRRSAAPVCGGPKAAWSEQQLHQASGADRPAGACACAAIERPRLLLQPHLRLPAP